jgi:hypothetical protein
MMGMPWTTLACTTDEKCELRSAPKKTPNPPPYSQTATGSSFEMSPSMVFRLACDGRTMLRFRHSSETPVTLAFLMVLGDDGHGQMEPGHSADREPVHDSFHGTGFRGRSDLAKGIPKKTSWENSAR